MVQIKVKYLGLKVCSHIRSISINLLAVLIVLRLMVCLYLLPLIHDQKPWDVAEQKMERSEHRLKKK